MSKEVVIERQMFLSEAFINSLNWGYGNIKTGIPLEDFLHLTSDLPTPEINHLPHRDNLIITFNKHPFLHEHPSFNNICFVSGTTTTAETRNKIMYSPTDYMAAIYRNEDEMNPNYSVEIHTTRKMSEVRNLQHYLFGYEPKFSLPKRFLNVPKLTEQPNNPEEPRQLPLSA